MNYLLLVLLLVAWFAADTMARSDSTLPQENDPIGGVGVPLDQDPWYYRNDGGIDD